MTVRALATSGLNDPHDRAAHWGCFWQDFFVMIFYLKLKINIWFKNLKYIQNVWGEKRGQILQQIKKNIFEKWRFFIKALGSSQFDLKPIFSITRNKFIIQLAYKPAYYKYIRPFDNTSIKLKKANSSHIKANGPLLGLVKLTWKASPER